MAMCMWLIVIITESKDSHVVQLELESFKYKNAINQYIYIYIGSIYGETVAGITGNNGGSYSQLYWPTGIYVDGNNTMFIHDWQNCRVLKWKLGDPMGYVVAGGNGCGGGANQIYNSYGIFGDGQNNIYISEYRNHRVTKWLSYNTTAGILVLLYDDIKLKFVSYHFRSPVEMVLAAPQIN